MKPVSGRAFCKVLESRGWVLRRISSSHHVYQHPGRPETISVPVHAHHDLAAGLQRALMRQAGLTDADLRRG